jgi:type II secretory pathway component GspD/PulD (secretin)
MLSGLETSVPVPESGNPPISASYACTLDDLQVHLLLRAVQAHKDSSVLAAPKVTALDGQTAALSVQTNVNYISGYLDSNLPSEAPMPKHELAYTGTQLQLLPKLTDDGANIKLDISFEISDVVGFEERMYKGKYPHQIPSMDVVSVSTTVSIPDGATVLIGGKKITAENEDGQKVEKNLLLLIKAKKVEQDRTDAEAWREALERGGY